MAEQEQLKTGGLIVTAGRGGVRRLSHPLLKIGAISAVKRIVLTFQQAGISPIVVVTGREAEEIGHDLADYGVIFLHNPAHEQAQMFDSAKIGLAFLRDKCRQVVFSPVDVPMFTPRTLQRLIHAQAEAIAPSCRGKAGHPLVLSAALIPQLLAYDGALGMRGALAESGVQRSWLDIDDEGILRDTDDIERLDQLLERHNRHILHPFVRISIEKETLFFNSRTKLLLLLIQETHSVRSACRHIALSYSKAWNMLNQLEQELGYAVVERQHGGNKGGKTRLTQDGERFLTRFCQYEEKVRRFAGEEFAKLF